MNILKKTGIWLMAVCLLCSGCRLRAQPYTYVMYEYFDTVITLTGYTSQQQTQEQGERLRELFSRLHNLMNSYDATTPEGIAAIGAAGGQWVTTDPMLIDVLQKGKEVYQQTEGRINIMAGAVTALWKNTTVVPSEAAIAQAMQHISIDALEIDAAGCRVRITDPEARADLGAIGKGYALDLAQQILREAEFSGTLSATSSVVLVGDKQGAPFSVGIRRPDSSEMLRVLSLKDTAFATSGTDQRQFTYNGKRYHHIIDLTTGYPADSTLVQASVVCQSALWADAYATDSILTGCLPQQYPSIGYTSAGETVINDAMNLNGEK